MKTYKFLFSALFAVLALTDFASAQTPIYISGAPATRKIFNIAIYNTLAAQTGGTASLVQYWTGSSGWNGANQIVITGGTLTLNGTATAVTVYGSWTGSTGGNQSVAQNPPQSISALKVGFINLSASGVAPGALSTSNTTNAQYPQFNLSDTQQVTTPFNGHVTVTSPATNYVTLNEATTANPAITGFKFVANNGAPARLNNITTNLAQQLFTSGGTPLAFFTGLNSDENTIIYPVGRDISSGARYILLAETGIGTANSSNLVQYEPAETSTTSITDIADNPAPGGTINLISYGVGNGGYPSFSKTLALLSATSTPAIGYVVTYVTDTDATTAEASGAHELAWNGVFYGTSYEGANNTAPTSIAEGQYTFWSYLHAYYNASYLNTNYPYAKFFADKVAADLSTDTATGAILTSDVNVGRTNDGGEVTANY